LSNAEIPDENRSIFSFHWAQCTGTSQKANKAFEDALTLAKRPIFSKKIAFEYALRNSRETGSDPATIINKSLGWSAAEKVVVSKLIKEILTATITPELEETIEKEVESNKLGLQVSLPDRWLRMLQDAYRYRDALLFAKKHLSLLEFEDYSVIYRSLYTQPNGLEVGRTFYDAYLPFATTQSFFYAGFNTYTYTELAQGPCSKTVLQGKSLLALKELTTAWRDGAISKDEIFQRSQALLRLEGAKADLLTFIGSQHEAKFELSAARQAYWDAHLACRYYERAHAGLMSVNDEELRRKSHLLPKFIDQMKGDIKGVDFPNSLDKWIINRSVIPDEGQLFLKHGVRFFAPYIDIMAETGKVYLKQTHELMSDVPGKEYVRDQRVANAADNRLRDDLTGMHGNELGIVVTERIFSALFINHNTLEHEAAHQFHINVLPERKVSMI
jgi:hypothetical protein